MYAVLMYFISFLDINNNIRVQQVVDLKEILKESLIPVYWVCGNHDIGNKPNDSTINWYNQHFGQDYYTMCYDGVLFVILNSQYMMRWVKIHQAEKQMDWFKKLLMKYFFQFL